MTRFAFLICLSLLCSCPEADPEPYSPCEPAGDPCNGDGLCTVDKKGSVCNPPCKDKNDCPPVSGRIECGGYCFVYCQSSNDCEAGMICSIVAPETIGQCVWPH